MQTPPEPRSRKWLIAFLVFVLIETPQAVAGYVTIFQTVTPMIIASETEDPSP